MIGVTEESRRLSARLYTISLVLIGLVVGLASVALWWLGVMLAAIATAVILIITRHRLTRLGLYLAAFGITGFAILVPTLRGNPCGVNSSGCDPSMNVKAAAVYALIAVAGVSLVARHAVGDLTRVGTLRERQ